MSDLELTSNNQPIEPKHDFKLNFSSLSFEEEKNKVNPIKNSNRIEIVKLKQPMTKRILNEDIYHLLVITYAKNKRFPIFLGILTLIILIIQISGIIGLIMGFNIETDIDNNITEYNQKQIYLTTIDQSLNISNITKNVLKEMQGTIITFTDNYKYYNHSYFRNTLLPTKNLLGFISLFVFLIYLMQSFSSHTFLYWLPNYIKRFNIYEPKMRIFIKFIALINILMSLISFHIGSWTIFYYGDVSDILNTLYTPIGLVFILELDDWAVKPILMLQFNDNINDDNNNVEYDNLNQTNEEIKSNIITNTNNKRPLLL